MLLTYERTCLAIVKEDEVNWHSPGRFSCFIARRHTVDISCRLPSWRGACLDAKYWGSEDAGEDPFGSVIIRIALY